MPHSKSYSYMFVVGHGTSSSIEGARQVALSSMAQKLETEHGLTVNTAVHIQETMTQRQSQTKTKMQQEIDLEVIEEGHKLKIVCRIIDEYWEKKRGQYHLDVLYAVTNTNSYGGSYDDDITVSANYGLAPGLMSIVPGVGQFYKGANFKAGAIIVGEVTTLGSFLVSETTRASYIKKMKEQPKHAQEYSSLADAWENVRNVSLGAAAAIYVYNLIDAFATPGAKRVKVNSKNNAHFSAMPYADYNSFGMSLAVNF